uniref:Bm13059 n=1 Tax=Brugia malayi TaxID=6279 RepID=A0A1I9G190_BRUMA|nr:Bm13059 [Brugia malayi]
MMLFIWKKKERERGESFCRHYDDHQNHCQQFGLSDYEALARMSLQGPGECYVNWNKVALDVATLSVTKSRIFAPESW